MKFTGNVESKSPVYAKNKHHLQFQKEMSHSVQLNAACTKNIGNAKKVTISKLYYFISQSPEYDSPETECKFLLCAFLRGVKSPHLIIGFSNTIYDPKNVKSNGLDNIYYTSSRVLFSKKSHPDMYYILKG